MLNGNKYEKSEGRTSSVEGHGLFPEILATAFTSNKLKKRVPHF